MYHSFRIITGHLKLGLGINPQLSRFCDSKKNRKKKIVINYQIISQLVKSLH